VIHYRRLVLSLVAELCIFTLELVHLCLTQEGPSEQGMAAMAVIAGAHYYYDSRNKVARAKAGIATEVD